ncbi:MAG: heat-inducible transcriptional repressor HrcA [Thalassobaculales bacterium]
MIGELNGRSREILKLVVDSYIETGEPVGSRTLSRRLGMTLSPATVRNVMADLEDAGLLAAPHTSAGRIPTDAGLRLFVDGLLEVGLLSEEERKAIESRVAATGRTVAELLEEATAALSGLSRHAGLVMAPKTESRLKHIEFVALSPGRALVVLVSDNGLVENRMIEVPQGLPPSALVEAANYVNARLSQRSIAEARLAVEEEIAAHRSQIDELTQRIVRAGLATAVEASGGGYLIVRGQSSLLADVTAIEDLARVKTLFAALEAKENMLRLLDATSQGEGVRIYIGAQTELFGLAGFSAIVAPYRNAREQVLGAIGVIGPVRMNYGRIIPMVDHTAAVIGKLIG